MRDWTVGGAVIETGVVPARVSAEVGFENPEGEHHPSPAASGVLLVRNLRADGRSDWTPPGGVIDPGEDLVEGLTREVREETGLEVAEWSPPLYSIVAEAPGLGWRLHVEVRRALDVRGRLRIGDDPDGIVVGADWVGAGACEQRLCDAHPWVREPLVEWMTERFESPRRFHYDVTGAVLSELSIRRR